MSAKEEEIADSLIIQLIRNSRMQVYTIKSITNYKSIAYARI